MWRTIASLALALASVAGGAAAQSERQGSDAVEQSALDEGFRDGRQAGRLAGDDLGRTQQLMAAWLSGYRRGLSDPVDAWRLDDAVARGRLAGRQPGLDAGLADGRERGAEEAALAYARLEGRPSFRSVAPERAEPPEPPPFSACEAPAPVTISLNRDRHVQVDPARQDSLESPIPYETPPPDYPRTDWLRERARQNSASQGEDVERWVFTYKSSFWEAWNQTFELRRMQGGTDSPRYETDGRAVGRTEGARRASCAAHERGHAESWMEAYEEGYERAYREGWDEAAARHDASPVIRLESAAIVDAGSDGVLEPGEEAALEARVANAGLVGQSRSVARWRAVRGLAADEGLLGGSLGAQERRTERVPLGAVDPGAPFGSTLVLEVKPEGGEAVEVEAKVGRPVILEGVDADLGVHEGRAAAFLRVRVESVSRRPTDRGLVVATEGGPELGVGAMPAGERRALDAIRPVALEAAVSGAELSGEVELRDGAGQTWMRGRWRVAADMRRAVRLAGGVADPAAAAPALSRRLEAELSRALEDPKLYKRLDEDSDLARFADELRQLAGPARERLAELVARPLLARADEKAVPRNVRRALRNALGEI